MDTLVNKSLVVTSITTCRKQMSDAVRGVAFPGLVIPGYALYVQHWLWLCVQRMQGSQEQMDDDYESHMEDADGESVTGYEEARHGSHSKAASAAGDYPHDGYTDDGMVEYDAGSETEGMDGSYTSRQPGVARRQAHRSSSADGGYAESGVEYVPGEGYNLEEEEEDDLDERSSQGLGDICMELEAAHMLLDMHDGQRRATASFERELSAISSANCASPSLPATPVVTIICSPTSSAASHPRSSQLMSMGSDYDGDEVTSAPSGPR